MQSEGPVEHVPVFGSTSGSVRSTSPNVQPSIPQPILTVQQQTQATAFVQPTQQSHPQIEPANQELSPNIVEVVQSSPVERPSTSTAVFGTGKLDFFIFFFNFYFLVSLILKQRVDLCICSFLDIKYKS